MPIERPPTKNRVGRGDVPKNATPYRVKDGDDWYSVARQFNVDVGALIEFNFKTRIPEEVNWYLRENVGCRRATPDGKNWMFSSDANPGVIYIPIPRRIVHSIGSLSWIDPRLYHPTDLPEVDHQPPASTLQKQAFFARQGYRFANFLEAYVVTNDRGEIVEGNYTKESGLYRAPSFRGIETKAYNTIQVPKKIAADRKSVVFTQLVGCKTVSPETIGAREGRRVVDSLLGIHPNWGGPLGVQAESVGARAGWKGGENIRVFPPIWTELELTMYADGSFDGRLVRYSLFPSVTFYHQSYARERVITDVSRYRQLSVYDARQQIEQWRSKGWGKTVPSSGASPGNPWGEPDPRIIPGCDVPKIVAPGIPRE